MDAITLAWTEAGQRKTQTFVDTYSTKTPGTIRVGRDPAQCDVVLPSLSASDRTVSRLHVEIAFNPTHSSFYLRNLKPQNPVQVDGSAVTNEAVLQEGSTIRLGKVEVEVAAVAAVPATIFVSASERPTLVYKPAEDTHVEAERSAQRHEIQSRNTPQEPRNGVTAFDQPTELEEQAEVSHQLNVTESADEQVSAAENGTSPPTSQSIPGQSVTGQSSTAVVQPALSPVDRAQDFLNSIPKPSFSVQSLLKPAPLAIGAAVLAAVGLLQWQRLNTITSTKAFVNSRIISITAPVSGELRLQNINSGQLVQEGVLLANIFDPRNIELQRTQQRLKNELENLIYRQQQLQVQLNDRRESFQRIQDEASTQQSLQQGSTEFLEAELDDAIATAREAQANVVQVRDLAAEGTMTDQEVELAEAARDSAEDVVNQLREQLASARRGDETEQQSSSVSTVVENRRSALQNEVANFEQVLENLQAESDDKQRQLDSITDRLSRQTPANITSPTAGEIWTVEYQPGLSNTVVVSGDGIVELAQCEGLWVEAVVSSRDATNISVGGDASIFIPDGFRHQKLDGVVREIRTSSEPVMVSADEVAISPENLGPGEVAVMVDLKSPENSGNFCNIGRTTEVRFSRS
ncbi:MAG: FHA domain-containing protein [Synechococcus sp.]